MDENHSLEFVKTCDFAILKDGTKLTRIKEDRYGPARWVSLAPYRSFTDEDVFAHVKMIFKGSDEEVERYEADRLKRARVLREKDIKLKEQGELIREMTLKLELVQEVNKALDQELREFKAKSEIGAIAEVVKVLGDEWEGPRNDMALARKMFNLGIRQIPELKAAE